MTGLLSPEGPGSVELDDTQKMPSQVYADYYQGRIASSKSLGTTSNGQTQPNSRDTAARTLETDDTGHVDLTQDFSSASQYPDQPSDSEEDELAIGSLPQDSRVSPLNANSPKTPALAGNKRDNRGDVISSARTPGSGLGAMFKSIPGQAVIGLSQVFNQTQAPSSPLPEGVRSDPIFERPSPDFHGLQYTSPALTMSSPNLARGDAYQYLISDPRDKYVPIQHSQEMRERRQRLAGPGDKNSSPMEDELDDGSDNDDSIHQRTAKLRRRAKIQKDAMRGFARLGQSPRGDKGKGLKAAETVINLVTPRQPLAEREVVTISDETPQGKLDSAEESMDEYDELSQAIIRSDRDMDDPELSQPASSPPVNNPDMQMGQRDHERYDELNGPNFAPEGPNGQQKTSHIVPNSQPNSQVEQHDLPAPRPILPMSIDSHWVISQSQGLSSSNGRAGPAASMPEDLAVKASSQPHLAASPPLNVPRANHSASPTPATRRKNRVPNTSPLANGALSIKRPFNKGSLGAGPSDQTPEVLVNSLERQHSAISGSRTDSAFVTGRSHQSPSPSTRSQFQMGSAESPERQRWRKLGDIAADPTPPDASNASVDVNVNIMNEDDVEFHAIMSGSSPVRPQSKRRRMLDGRALREPAKEVNALPPTSPRKHGKETLGTEDLSRVTKQLRPARSEGKLRKPTRTRPHHAEREPTVAAPEEPSAAPDETGDELASAPKVSQKRRPNAQKVDKTPLLQTQYRDVSSHTDRESSHEVLVPNRVLARFNGHNQSFYPATCMGETDGSYKVRFDDGMTDIVKPSLVRDLQLRVGDVVRVDINSMRTKTFAVCGYKNCITKEQLESEEYPTTDIYGHQTVVLTQKLRDGLPSTEQIDVPMESVYISLTLWPRFQERPFKLPDKRAERVETPSIQSRPRTPPSRRRADKLSLQVNQLVAGEVKGLLANMAFAVSYSDKKAAERDRITNTILDNGGRVLLSGFEELFEPLISADQNTALSLNPGAEKLGFTALIGDSHSRTSKYMQALALDVPCLSSRWISDCVSQNVILPWGKYLLPAGVSTFLGGAVRSRTFREPQFNSVSEARLKTTIEQRPKLFDGRNVLLVTGKGKAEEERRWIFLFLTYVLGAHVEQARDLAEVEKLLEMGQKWDWVHVEGKPDDARSALFGNGQGKRKRRSEAGALRVEYEDKIVNDEFVLQSLILGALVDE